MVSVADEGGNLVLMGVDATYCVVDEVDTTSSTLQDIFLQEAFETADTDVHGQDGLHGDYLQDAVKTTAEEVVKATDKMLKRKRRKRKSQVTDERRTSVDEGQAGVAVDTVAGSDAGSNVVVVMPTSTSRSSFLRSALMGKPVSLREPGLPGRLNFCLQRTDSLGELGRHGDSPPESREGSPSDGDSHAESREGSHPESRESSRSDGEPDGARQDGDDIPAQVEPTVDDRNANTEQKAAKAKKGRWREKHYQCGVCERWFGCKSHVVEHMRTHTGEKPYKCPLCDRCFSQKSNIYQHMNTHTLERPFRCEDCGKDFMYRGSLYKHKRLHTGERPYCCGVCSWRFTHASQLFEHLRTHTNEKPFKCGVCGRAFAHSGTMHRHQRNHFNHLTPKGEGVGGGEDGGWSVTHCDGEIDCAGTGNDGKDSAAQQMACNATQQLCDSGAALTSRGNDNCVGGKVKVSGSGGTRGSQLADVNHTTDVTNADFQTSQVLSDGKMMNTNNSSSGPGDVGKMMNTNNSSSGPGDVGKMMNTNNSSSGPGDVGKSFSCEVCNKTFAHRRSVRRHKQSSHHKLQLARLEGHASVAQEAGSVHSISIPPSSDTTTTTTTKSEQSAGCGSSVIRLLLSRKPTDQAADDAGYVSKLIFGSCLPPSTPATSSFTPLEQNNNDPAPTLLKRLLAATASRRDNQGTLQSLLQPTLLKNEPDTGGDTWLDSQNLVITETQHVSNVRIKQEPQDA